MRERCRHEGTVEENDGSRRCLYCGETIPQDPRDRR